MLKNYFLKSIMLFIGMLLMATASQAQIYVNSTAGGANNGSSWANAYTDLQTALAAAVSPNEIWVAAGTYYPTQVTTDRNATFQLKNGVALYGGFTGTETMLYQRNWEANVTILSGDINGNGSLAGNSYSVVTGSGTNTTAVIDGFTITMGWASGSIPDNRGGGMYNSAGSPTVTNCSFYGNAASNGGGMYNFDSSPTITNCTFSENQASLTGAGMFNHNNSSPTITNCSFSGNTANTLGGGMYNLSSSPTLVNCSFSGNSANTRGGGMFNISASSPSLTNCTFSGNSADEGYGGGMYNNFSCSPTVTNCSFSGNSANEGGGMYNRESSSPTITNCILWGNSSEIFNINSSDPVVNYSIVQGGYAGTGNLNADPLFVSQPPVGLGTSGNLRLQSGSPAIDAGLNSANTTITDLDGNPRVLNGTIDMGAYEFGCSIYTGNVIFVDADATTGGNNGTSWTDAFTDLQDALNSTCPDITEIWVAAGTYYPTSGTDRTISFVLKNGVAVYGGFNGTETLLSERDWVNNVSILSGDINHSGNLTGNSYTVVNGSGTNATAVIDGFTITSGNSNGTSPNNQGGGMYNNAGSPTVTNSTFSGNSATAYGGGMYNEANSSPTVMNCIFSGNSAAGGYGGGMYNFDNSSPTITNCTFSGNTADAGGGMYNWASSPEVINCTFSGNSAVFGGGMFNDFYSLSTITNSIIWGNSSGIVDDSSTPTVSYSIVQSGYTGTGNLDVDPLFVDQPLVGLGTGGDLRLQAHSPAINMGNNSALPPGITTDLDGNPRISGNAVDMGAYEFQVEDTPVNLDLNGLVIRENDSECFGATQNITVQDVSVDAGGSLTLIAGNSIIITPEFNVAANAYFHAYISDEYCVLPASLLALESEVKNNPALDFNENLADDLRIFPNPTTGGFTIEMGETFGSNKTSVSVYNLIGELILTNENVLNQAEFNLSGYPNGMYVIMIRNNENTEIRKLIKQ